MLQPSQSARAFVYIPSLKDNKKKARADCEGWSTFRRVGDKPVTRRKERAIRLYSRGFAVSMVTYKTKQNTSLQHPHTHTNLISLILRNTNNTIVTLMTQILCTPIGYVSSPFKQRGDAPRQGRLTEELSVITLEEQFLPAADGLESGADVFILCWFDRADRTILKSKKGGDENQPERGVFTNRSPNRPNPIALTLVKIISIDGCRITVKGLEAYDGTPVLDIKPYYEGIDSPEP